MAKSGKGRHRRGRQHIPVGAPPGTLIADPLAHPTHLRLTLIAPDRHHSIDHATMADIVSNRGKWPVIWLDCAGLADVALIEEIGRQFGLHPLALEDVVNSGQRPKVEFFDDYVFVALRVPDQVSLLHYEQISIFFGEKFVITFQDQPGDPFDPIRRHVATEGPNRLRECKVDYLAYALIDAVVDSYFTPIEMLSDKIEKVEESILDGTHKNPMQDLHGLRREIMGLKGILWPLRDALAALIRNDDPFVMRETKIFLNDTLDHAMRMIELVESQRDTLTGLIEVHLSLAQARTNDVISLLTIVSTIFIPLTFLVGVWGMNFDPDLSPWNMPELRSYYGYPAALLFMISIAAALFGLFKWKKWL